MYKNRSQSNASQAAYGDWRGFFAEYARQRTKRPIEWGGSWATRSAAQKRIFQEEVRVGDLILCYQTDVQAGIGVARVTTLTQRGDGENQLWLEPVERFPKPVRLHDLKKKAYPQLQGVFALKAGPIMTLYETNRQEAYWLLDAAQSSQRLLFK